MDVIQFTQNIADYIVVMTQSIAPLKAARIDTIMNPFSGSVLTMFNVTGTAIIPYPYTLNPVEGVESAFVTPGKVMFKLTGKFIVKVTFTDDEDESIIRRYLLDVSVGEQESDLPEPLVPNADETGLIAFIRAFLRDTSATNRVLKEQELNDSEILISLNAAINKYNTMHPQKFVFSYTKLSTEIPMLEIAFGAAGFLLLSLSHSQLRNQILVKGEGRTLSISDKGAMYQQIGNGYLLRFDRWVIEHKQLLDYGYAVKNIT